MESSPFANPSRADCPLAPSDTIALESVGVGRRADEHLAADREPEAADPPGIDVGAAAQKSRGGEKVSLSVPAERVRVALAHALAATVEEQDAVAVADEHARVLLRAGATREAITVAPFRDGTNQPCSRRPSLVVNATFSCGAPSFGGGTSARAVCVTTWAIAVGSRTYGIMTTTPTTIAARRRYRREPAVVRPARAPERHCADAEQHEAADQRQEAGEVVAGCHAAVRVVRRLGAGEDAEEAGDERDRASHARRARGRRRLRPTRVAPGDESAHQMVGRRGTWLRLEEVVVDDVERDEPDRHSGHDRLGQDP